MFVGTTSGQIAVRCGGRSSAVRTCVIAAYERADRPDAAVRPRLRGDPLDRVVAVLALCGVDGVEVLAACPRSGSGRGSPGARRRSRAGRRSRRSRCSACRSCRTASGRGSSGSGPRRARRRARGGRRRSRGGSRPASAPSRPSRARLRSSVTPLLSRSAGCRRSSTRSDVAGVEDGGRVELLDDGRARRRSRRRAARSGRRSGSRRSRPTRRSRPAGAPSARPSPPGSSGRGGGFAIRPTLVSRRLTPSTGSSGALKPYVRSCSAWKRSSRPSPAGIVSSKLWPT